MIVTRDADSFMRFLERRKPALQRISRHTRGESSLDEVQSEAWLMIDTFACKSVVIDLDDPVHQDRLIAHLYQHLVRYTELNVRHAVRLDHAPNGDDAHAHPLMNLLTAGPQYDPVNALMQAEEEPDACPTGHQSLAGAYLQLLRRFDNRMLDVADHLLISVSYCYRRCAHARRLAVHQHPLPSTPAADDVMFVPGAWRRFRMMRKQVQLSLDFDVDVNLFGSAQN